MNLFEKLKPLPAKKTPHLGFLFLSQIGTRDGLRK